MEIRKNKVACALSVIIPVYNSANIFPELHRRLVAALEPVVDSFEIIAVLDGCRDHSQEVVGQIALRDGRVRMIEFSRNFGHQAALTAGLRHALGEAVAVIDDDLEDPPELLPRFLELISEGCDVVYGIRRKRKRSFFYRLMYKLFYRIAGSLSEVSIPNDAGDFCMMSRQVVQILNSMPENNRYLRGMRAWTGFRQIGFEYDREERFADQPGYNLRKYVALGFDGIFAFSDKPLKCVTMVGLVIAFLSFVQASYIIYVKLTGRMPNVPGWASLSVSILFLSGIQLIAMGIIGEYIARIYDEVKHRPPYIIRSKIGFLHENADQEKTNK